MAHKIFGNRFISRSQPAWHGLGTVFADDEILLPSVAVQRVTGDVQIERVPLFYTLPGTKEQRQSDSYVIVRLPTKDDSDPREIGVTSEKWHATTYSELASALDGIDVKKYRIETAGLLSGGDLCFFSLRGEDWSVLQTDEMRSYFLVNLSLRPGVAHRALHTSTRVVCHNTNQAAIASSQIQLQVPHTADAKAQIELAGFCVMRFREAQEETKRIFEVFAQTEAPKEKVDQIFRDAWPEPELPQKVRMVRSLTSGGESTKSGGKLRKASAEELQAVSKAKLDARLMESIQKAEEQHHTSVLRVKELREGAWQSFEEFEPAKLRGTVWAAYNAVTEVADWRGDGRSVGESVLVGTRSKEKLRAFEKSMALCGLGD